MCINTHQTLLLKTPSFYHYKIGGGSSDGSPPIGTLWPLPIYRGGAFRKVLKLINIYMCIYKHIYTSIKKL